VVRIQDQDTDADADADKAPLDQAHISALYVYPVKSARGLTPTDVPLVHTGFEHDRQWLVVDERRRFLTQRELPLLATLRPALAGDTLMLDAPTRTPLTLAARTERDSCRVRIWGDECAAFDCGDTAANWLSTWLGRKLRLVRFDTRSLRLSNSGWTGSVAAPNLFTDGYPILVANTASLADLNARMGRELPMERFRPNIVLDGLPPYAEDRIAELHCGDVQLRLVKPCVRCSITTTDQKLGALDGDEPLRTLKSYRHDRQLNGVTFAQNAIIVSGVGARLRVGDRFSLVWRDVTVQA
jgi:uncharacterized protein YcbX